MRRHEQDRLNCGKGHGVRSMPDGPRYDDDFYAWTQFQAQVLRSLRTRDNRFDREHLAEEIEDLGKSERNAVRSQIARKRAGLELAKHGEQDAARSLPSVCPYTVDEILAEDWYPEPR